jgi:FMN-dependent NADH-azoreductase
VITPSAVDFALGTPMAGMNFCETYLRSILGFIGIEDITIIAVPNQFMPDEIRQQSIEQARIKLMAIAATW